MGRFSLFSLLFLSFSLSAQSLYLSDGLGTQLAPISKIRGTEEWYLSVASEAGISTRTLYHNQEEWKRWEDQYASSTPSLRIERYYYKNRLREVIEYNDKGRVLSEQFYDSDGALLEHRQYLLDEKGSRSKILLLNESGVEDVTYSLLYREDHSLREIIGENPAREQESRILWRSQDRDARYFDSVFMQDGTTGYRYTYEESNLAVRLRYRGDEEIEKILYDYKNNGKLSKETIWTYSDSDNILTVLLYDDLGQVIQENQFLNGILRTAILQTYEEDRLIRYQERSGSERILWEYEYEEGTDDLIVSTLYRNGILVKKLIREESRTRRIIYKDNEPVYEDIIDEDEGDGS